VDACNASITGVNCCRLHGNKYIETVWVDELCAAKGL